MKQLATAMEQGDTDAIKAMHRAALLELAVYEQLPCNGRINSPGPREKDRRSLSNCTLEFAATCPMRDHRACPRVLREAMAGRYGSSPSDVAAEMRRALVPSAIASLVAHGQCKKTKAISAAEQWANGPARVLVLSGGPRVGKTVAACWVVHHLGKSALFYNPELLGRYGGDDGYRLRAAACGLLIVDDLGTEAVDEAGRFQARLEALLCTRYDSGLRTILTTNLAAGAFAKRYGDRVAARIQTGGKFIALGVSDVPADREPGSDDD
jgi:hypothetical protein